MLSSDWLLCQPITVQLIKLLSSATLIRSGLVWVFPFLTRENLMRIAEHSNILDVISILTLAMIIINKMTDTNQVIGLLS